MNTSNTANDIPVDVCKVTHNALAVIIDGQTIATTKRMLIGFIPIEWALVEDGEVKSWYTTTEAIRAMRAADMRGEEVIIKAVTRITL